MGYIETDKSFTRTRHVSFKPSRVGGLPAYAGALVRELHKGNSSTEPRFYINKISGVQFISLSGYKF